MFNPEVTSLCASTDPLLDEGRKPRKLSTFSDEVDYVPAKQKLVLSVMYPIHITPMYFWKLFFKFSKLNFIHRIYLYRSCVWFIFLLYQAHVTYIIKLVVYASNLRIKNNFHPALTYFKYTIICFRVKLMRWKHLKSPMDMKVA